MRKTMGTIMALAMLAQADAAFGQFGFSPPPPPPPAPASAPDNPLALSSKWQADFGDNSCTLAAEFGTDKNGVELAFKPATGTESVQLWLMYHGATPKSQATGSVRLAIYPSGNSVVGTYSDVKLGADSPYERLMIYTFPRHQLGDVSNAQEIAFVFGRQLIALTSTTSFGAVAKTLATCEDDLVKSWGYDPAVMHGLKTKPIPVDFMKWYTAKDFPTKAEAKDVRAANVRFTVGADGVVTNCAVVETSGSDMFDKKACELMTTKAHFTPATDAGGKPVPALQVQPVGRPFSF